MPTAKSVVTSTLHTLTPGTGSAGLESGLRKLAAQRKWDINLPLPTTRELGDYYSISNASACRLLKRLDAEKVIWRRENGRYYLAESQRIFDRPKPYACLLRKLQNWSRIYQGVMSGFSEAFGRNRAAMLFVHNENLVRHADTAHPPVHAGAEAQREALAEFFRDHDDHFGGILLDDVWLDEVLAEFSDRLENAVIVCRPTKLPGLASVSVDFDSSAVLAIGHLFARGYEEIWLAVPFTHAAPVDLMCQAARRAAATLGKPIDPKNICFVTTPEERSAFLQRLKESKKRVGVFCVEDNVALILWRMLRESGITSPERVGILSGMGTDIVTERQITTLQIDYARIGREAGEILAEGLHRTTTLPAALVLGETT
ncbi:MAG TPA: substrate-binding domain-containing protein [Opitutaceae bacterium]|nr:substrate-binding domain-containing protein [Opitutaceae bacterium]